MRFPSCFNKACFLWKKKGLQIRKSHFRIRKRPPSHPPSFPRIYCYVLPELFYYERTAVLSEKNITIFPFPTYRSCIVSVKSLLWSLPDTWVVWAPDACPCSISPCRDLAEIPHQLKPPEFHSNARGASLPLEWELCLLCIQWKLPFPCILLSQLKAQSTCSFSHPMLDLTQQIMNHGCVVLLSFFTFTTC